jgi:hypothetical protein
LLVEADAPGASDRAAGQTLMVRCTMVDLGAS